MFNNSSRKTQSDFVAMLDHTLQKYLKIHKALQWEVLSHVVYLDCALSNLFIITYFDRCSTILLTNTSKHIKK